MTGQANRKPGDGGGDSFRARTGAHVNAGEPRLKPGAIRVSIVKPGEDGYPWPMEDTTSPFFAPTRQGGRLIAALNHQGLRLGHLERSFRRDQGDHGTAGGNPVS